MAYDAEESRLLLFMIWFTEFQRELAVSIEQVKISKDALFEAFMTLILSSKQISPVLKEMQAFIEKNRLREHQAQMMSMLMYDHANPYMVMKSKNPEFESDSEEEPLAGEGDPVQLYDKELKKSLEPEILGPLTANTNIEISRGLYEEFLGAMGRAQQEQSPGSGAPSQDSASSGARSAAEYFSKATLKTSLEKGLDAVINCLTELRNKSEEEPGPTIRTKGGQDKQPGVDEHVDAVRLALVKNLKR